MPTLVLRGEHAPRPTYMIAEMLAAALSNARLAVVDGAGHMGPLTHAAAVDGLIAGHIRAVETPTARPPPARAAGRRAPCAWPKGRAPWSASGCGAPRA